MNQGSIEIDESSIRNKSAVKTPSQNFRYYLNKNQQNKHQREPMTDRSYRKSKANISMEGREPLANIADEDFTQRVYGAYNLPKRRSQTNQGSRTRNNGKLTGNISFCFDMKVR